MRRREFDVRYPVRSIRLEDTRQEFHSGLLRSCGMSLSSMYADNVGDRHVLVYDVNGIVSGVMRFTDRQDHIHIDVVSNNFALPMSFLKGEKPGTHLYSALELAARLAGIRRITLTSVHDRVGYWEWLGFRASGKIYEGVFCMLLPMVKDL